MIQTAEKTKTGKYSNYIQRCITAQVKWKIKKSQRFTKKTIIKMPKKNNKNAKNQKVNLLFVDVIFPLN